jgi:hypothetical protein
MCVKNQQIHQLFIQFIFYRTVLSDSIKESLKGQFYRKSYRVVLPDILTGRSCRTILSDGITGSLTGQSYRSYRRILPDSLT